MTTLGSGGSVERADDHERKRRPLWLETLVLLVGALGLAILVKTLLLQAFYIPSESMEPGLVRNDRILVQKVSYWFGGSPQRGDVVVFKDPGGWLPPEEATGPTGPIARILAKVGLYPSGGHLVKRVIGVAGDTIHCCDAHGRITVNGVALHEQGYARKGGGGCCGPDERVRLDGRPGARGRHLRDGRQPQRLGGLVLPPVPDPGLRPVRRVRPGRPGRGQGVRAAVAVRATWGGCTGRTPSPPSAPAAERTLRREAGPRRGRRPRTGGRGHGWC